MKYLLNMSDQIIKALIPIASILIFSLTNCSEQKPDIKFIVQQRYKESELNLIPDSAGVTPSYWCTWSSQNFATDTFTVRYCIEGGHHSHTADNLTEEAVFRNPGWEKQMPQKIKKDLYLMFDLGWDIPADSYADKTTKWILGTSELATDKFPSCTGTFAERLTKLNSIVKEAGWKGAGLWIAAHTSFESKGLKYTAKEEESFFRERLKWSKVAGIQYWKVDYGAKAGDIKFREMLTRLAHEEYPALWIEHGRSGSPFNDQECPYDPPGTMTGSFKQWNNGKALLFTHDLLNFTDVLRTYDVSAQLSIPTTLDRVAQILNSFTSKPNSRGIINCEDEPYIAAVLGCASGIMRHPAFLDYPGFEYDPLQVKKQMDASIRSVRWQRMSPAFSVGSGETNIDTVNNIDYWNFKPGQTWAYWMFGKTVSQIAPARVARGMNLPIVKSDSINPYVICSRFPNGNYAVGTMLRTDSVKGFIYPLADVAIQCDQLAPVGIFGNFKSLTIYYNPEINFKQVFMQDLAGDKAIDITDLITRDKKSIKLSGELLTLVGLSAAEKNDVSEPGSLLIFR